MTNPEKLLKNQYQIERGLGQGGFGRTYLAIDTHHPDRIKVAIKQFFPAKQYDDAMMKRLRRWFDREAQLLNKLGAVCRLIPQRYDYFEEDGKVYIVQEFIEGSDLSSFIVKGKVLSEREAIQIVKNILIPLEFVHERKVIHRDLKPSNLRVRKVNNTKDEIVLLDFGISREIQNDLQSLSEVVGAGTIDYMPPEQRAGRPTLGSDIYPIGIIGLQAITGWGVSTIRNLDRGGVRLKDGTISPHANINASRQFIRFLSKALAEDPENRFANATEALNALKNLDCDLPETQPDRDLPSTIPETRPDREDPKPSSSPPTKPKSSKYRYWLKRLSPIVAIGSVVGAITQLWGIAVPILEPIVKGEEWIPYQSSKYGVQLSYPKTWTRTPQEPEFDRGVLAILYPPEQKSECGDKITIGTVATTGNSAPDIEELKFETIDRIKKSNNRVSINDDKTTINTRLSQFPAFRIDYQREDSLCGSRQGIEIGAIGSNGRSYSVLYDANPQTSNKNLATFEKIVERLKLD
jgi:eukaryotic-like serine/threonine-protein kinase